MIRRALALALASIVAAGLAACGSKNTALDTDASQTIDGTGTVVDAGNGHPDGHTIDANLSHCIAGKPQCADGCDNDNDGKIDGDDPECTGSLDNNEGSFATGIPGDNINPVKQDCFFDGNSGSGNDGCDIHVCCILTDPNCPSIYHNPPYDPTKCTQTQTCIDNCEKLTPPGCDCFGCCTVCDATGCVTIDVNPADAPSCSQDDIHDPTKCPVCTPNTQCGSACGGATCVLCPGQDPSTLPASCGGTTTCPGGLNKCTTSTDCGSSQYCANGCCIAVVN